MIEPEIRINQTSSTQVSDLGDGRVCADGRGQQLRQPDGQFDGARAGHRHGDP